MQKAQKITRRFIAIVALTGSLFTLSTSAQAIELDWSGQFWSEYHLVDNYTMDSSDAGGIFDPSRTSGNQPQGYYIPGGGARSASFQTLFLRLRPKLVVNDNVYVKSEWWLGDPIYGVFGNSLPYSPEQRLYNSTFSRGAPISAQRFWLELLSDFGTVQIGRVPLEWGLGVVWNSGDQLFSRYVSTGDAVRLISRFGAFTFSPSVINYSTGNNLGGACQIAGGICTPVAGKSGVSDYSLMLKYENLEEDFDGGVNFVKRLAGSSQDVTQNIGPNGAAVSSNYNIWDIYGRKKVGPFTLAAEIPVTSGSLGGQDYSTVAVAAEVDWKMSESWELQARGGHAPGQPSGASATPAQYKAFYFHPNYHLGQIMFNYQLANFAGYPGTNTLNNPTATESNLRSPWDNPIVNANYFSLGGLFRTQKWTFNTGIVYARAPETAGSDGFYFDTRKRQMIPVAAGAPAQAKNLGVEWDLGASFQWDDTFLFRVDMGMFFPGDFHKFSNTAKENATNMVFGTSARVGISF